FVVVLALARRVLVDAVALRGRLGGVARSDDARVVVAAGAIPTLDALQVALEDVAVVHRPIRPRPAPHPQPQIRRVRERRCPAGRLSARAEVDGEALALRGREAGAERALVHLLDPVELQARDPVAIGGD